MLFTLNSFVNKKNRWRLAVLYVLGLVLAISAALPAYIQSNFLNQFVSLKTVSAFFMIANILTVAAIIVFPSFIKKFTNYFSAKIILIIYAAALLGLTITTEPILAFFSIILLSVSSNLIWINMDVLVESCSSDYATGRIRTIYFTFINFGWILAPSLSSYLIKRGDYPLAFWVSACLVLPAFLIFLFQARHLQDRVDYKGLSLLPALKNMWRLKNLRGIFFIALLLNIFYSAAVVYMPIYLYHNIGLGWGSLGLIFSFMLVPFLLIEIPAGILADKYWGEKELLGAGLTIVAIALFLFFYIKSPLPLVWALILFLSRIGAALVEAMRETYFFKIIDAKDISYINIFRTTAPLGYIIGPGLAILITLIWPLNYLFLCLSILMLIGLASLTLMKDTK